MLSLLTTFLQAAATVEKTMEKVDAKVHLDLEQIITQIVRFCIDAGKSILLAIIIFVVGRFIISALNKLSERVMDRHKLDATIHSFLKNFVNITLNILLLVSVVSALGVNTTSFAALLASAGVAIGMALSGNLQNLAGGLIVLFFKPYRVGDYIDAQGVSGTVREIQIFHTVMVTPDNKVIYVPNGSLSSGSVINYSLSDNRRVDWQFGVDYGTDINKVRETLLDIIKADERILSTPTPFIALGSLADSSVVVTVRVWVANANYWDVYFDMNEKVYNEFNSKDINFPFPQITVHKA